MECTTADCSENDVTISRCLRYGQYIPRTISQARRLSLNTRSSYGEIFPGIQDQGPASVVKVVCTQSEEHASATHRRPGWII